MWLSLSSQDVCSLGKMRDEIWKSLYFRPHYTMQHGMDILSVCGHFWMEELMWMLKMWDRRERDEKNHLWVSGKLMDRLWDWQKGTIRIIYHWYFNWNAKLFEIQFTFLQNKVCLHHFITSFGWICFSFYFPFDTIHHNFLIP